MLFEKSKKSLELPKVLSMLASEAASEDAKSRASELSPLLDADEIVKAQQETTDAAYLLGKQGSPGFSALANIKDALIRADVGGVLSIPELLQIAGVLRCTRLLKQYRNGSGNEHATCLDELFALLSNEKELETTIENAVENEERLSDHASSELRSIRRNQNILNAKIRDLLQKMITSKTHAKHLQEQLVTMRSGRYVVPVKAEYRGEIKGIVHDTSASGSTVFIEPSAVVESNNQIRILEAAEKKEVERILAELSVQVAERASRIEQSYDLAVALDFIFAKAKLSYKLRGIEPQINANGITSINKGRHPLINMDSVVPITISLGSEFDTMVITGPNTGGKTVALKTMGLFTLMAQCGLHVPAEAGTEIAPCRAIYADIGDEQSIEQSLSTFSSHMTNIVKILAEAEHGDMILFDELGAGTDPAEGAALAIAIIESARQRGIRVIATTHYAELKMYALNTARVVNASCEFDVGTLKPTYRLLIGIPGKSNAFAICRRLGISEDILTMAESELESGSKVFESTIEKLDAARQSLESKEEETERLLSEARSKHETARAREDRLNADREKLLLGYKKEALQILEDAKKQAAEALAGIAQLKKESSHEELNRAKSELNRQFNEAEDKISLRQQKVNHDIPQNLAIGDSVEFADSGTAATVVEVPDADGKLVVLAGIMKISTHISKLRPAKKKAAAKMKGAGSARKSTIGAQVSTSLDLRGKTSDEALQETENFIDRAIVMKIPSFTIIHGKGTGALRTAIHKYLKTAKTIRFFRLGTFGEGDNGVTIVEL